MPFIDDRDSAVVRIMQDVKRLRREVDYLKAASPYVPTSEGNNDMISGITSDIINTTPTQVIAAQGVGVAIKLQTLLVTNGSDDTGTFVNITDGDGGAILFTGYAVYGGGFSVTFPTPLEFSNNTAIYAVCATTGALVRVSAVGYV